MVEHRGVHRPIEADAGGPFGRPAHLRLQCLEARHADPHSLQPADPLGQRNLAAMGSQIMHPDFEAMFPGTAEIHRRIYFGPLRSAAFNLLGHHGPPVPNVHRPPLPARRNRVDGAASRR